MSGIIASNWLPQQPTTILNQSLPQSQGDWTRFIQRLAETFQSVSNAQYTTGVNAIPGALSVYFGSPTSYPAISTTGATVSLDNSNPQFGQYSYKLVATASTVTVQFNGYPCTIQPSWQWIGSVYIKGTATPITGTLALITATTTHTVNISGDIGNAWSRLYGGFDLTADSHAQATVQLQLTGVTIGQTYWLEAWQLEPTQGTTSLPSPYILTQPPVNQDQLPDGSTYGRVNQTNLTSNNVDFAQTGLLNKNQDHVADGSTYARILGTQLSSGSHKLTVPGSGMQVGDQRNMPAVRAANMGSQWSGLTISFTSAAGTPATATISVTAAALQFEFGTVSYGAMSVNVTGTNSTLFKYFLYVDDPAYTGGTLTLQATTNNYVVTGLAGRVFVGTCSITYPGSGSGSGGGSGGGGGFPPP